jgi:hypothetical protein
MAFLPNDPVNAEIPLDYTPSDWQYAEDIGESLHNECREIDRVRRRFWRQPKKMKFWKARNRKDMEIVETQRRHGQEWKDPFLPGDPPRFSPQKVIPHNYIFTEWQYSRHISRMLVSWHDECSMFDQVRKRTWKAPGRHGRDPPVVLEFVDEGKDDVTDDDSKQCPVCMENLKAVSGKCGHLLCFACSKKIRQDLSNCPTCRECWIPTVRVYL